MKIIANGIDNIQQLKECVDFIENEFTTDRSTENVEISFIGEYGKYRIEIYVYYDEVLTIEIEVM